MRIEPTGIVLVDTCSVQTEKCVAREAAPITAVWTMPGRVQVNVCRPCLEEQVRSGEWEIRGARIERRADVAVYSRDKKLQLVVEVQKKPRDGSNLKKWAATVHRNLLAHSGIPTSPYFLLAVLPDRFYLWKSSDRSRADALPDYEIKAEKALKPYLDQLSFVSDRASEYDLETVVASWLKDLVESSPADRASLKWFNDSGLSDAIKNGSVVMQAPIAA